MTNETDIKVPVTECEARAAYIAMSGKRSALRVRESFVKQGCKTPSLRTFDKWRAKHEWIRLAKEHDEKVATAAAEKIAEAATAGVVHEDPPHRLRGRTEEVRSALPFGGPLHQAEVHFVDERRRL